ncbi:hypothetical protein C8J56DRAFT_1040256 [Mycena floridula]|nr:hypothetical protein C8J56DRAFT_1040256 [Mycena floridula]
MFYRDRVKILCITEELDILDLHAVLSACSGVQQLGLGWYYHFPGRWTMSRDGLHAYIDALTSSGPRPSKLACNDEWTSRPDGTHRLALPLFYNITHLELTIVNADDFQGQTLQSLQKLTHLALVDALSPLPDDIVPTQQLALANSIAVCIIYADRFSCIERAVLEEIRKGFLDPRVVLARMRPPNDHGNVLCRHISTESHFVVQWGRPMKEEEKMDMWEEAEAIVKSQRMKASSSWLRLAQLDEPFPAPDDWGLTNRFSPSGRSCNQVQTHVSLLICSKYISDSSVHTFFRPIQRRRSRQLVAGFSWEMYDSFDPQLFQLTQRDIK